MRKRLWIGLVSVLGLSVGAHSWLEHQPLAAGLDTLEAPQVSASTASTWPELPSPPPVAPDTAGTETAAIATGKAPAPGTISAGLSGTLNLLVVGLDRRPGRQHGGRPDTLILAVFKDQQLGLVSIPRDLYVELPDWGPDRVNASFAAARNAGQRPLELLERVVEDTLKVPIEHTLAIDLGGFEAAVNALGGIHVQVRCPIIDNFIDPRSPSGRRKLSLAEGKQIMDGATAAMYVRSRHGRSDWSRARRQQAVLFAIKERATSLGGLARLPSFMNQLESLLITDMTRSELIAIVGHGLAVEPDRIHGLVLGHAYTEAHRTADGKAVLLPKHDAIQAALGNLFNADAPGTLPANARCAPADAAMRRRGTQNPAAGETPSG